MPKFHPSITTQRVMELVEDDYRSLDNPGICIACGEQADGCEPDARAYRCESCDKRAVYGAEELLLMLA